MALTIHDQELNEVKEENKKLRRIGLMIASQRINLPGESGPYQDKTSYPEETEGQKLEKSGQYLKDPETEVDTSQPLESRMFDIDPKKHKTQQKKQKIFNKATDPQAKGAEKDWLKKTGAQLPKLNIKPADLLKILQFLPALTGGGLGQMAGVNYGPPTERDKWLQLYQGPGGTLRHLDPDMRKLILNRGAMKAQGKQETIGPDPRNPVGTDLFIRPSDQRRIRNFDKYFGSKLA